MIEEAEKELKKAKDTLQECEKEQNDLDKLISEIIEKGFPEAKIELFSASLDENLPGRILDSKLQVKRSLSDYQILETVCSK